MFVLGLTGSIGMGKSTCAAMFRELGVPVHDADRVVHQALAQGGAAVAETGRLFPKSQRDHAIDRNILGEIVFSSVDSLRQLESILHPLVAASTVRFLRQNALAGARLAVLDIPLLFETGAEDRVDAILVVSAPAMIQAYRVMSRPGMTQVKFDNIRAHQYPDELKKEAADYVVSTGRDKAHTFASISMLVELLTDTNGHVWAPGYAARHFARLGK